ncbi:hypothetical protein, partial [Lysinibacillus agricola]|uniref:hypothetical protein n=1 Tax=Lysinibacillus agricola TaxID=2590012 RepID=UPI003C1EFE54
YPSPRLLSVASALLSVAPTSFRRFGLPIRRSDSSFRHFGLPIRRPDFFPSLRHFYPSLRLFFPSPRLFFPSPRLLSVASALLSVAPTLPSVALAFLSVAPTFPSIVPISIRHSDSPIQFYSRNAEHSHLPQSYVYPNKTKKGHEFNITIESCPKNISTLSRIAL